MRIILVLLIIMIHAQALAQRYISKSSGVKFFSEAPLENIEASNQEATSVFDLANGEIVFSVPIRGFKFKKSLMQKHFNENYMESEIYPKSTFSGKVSGFGSTDGVYRSTARGELTIHGQTRKVVVDGKVTVGQNELVLNARFPVALEDYGIEIPRLLFSNIAETVEVTIEFTYRPYEAN